MAMIDYKWCDVCGCKTFYDSVLDYGDYEHVDENNNLLPVGNIGSWAVLCKQCTQTHAITITKREAPHE